MKEMVGGTTPSGEFKVGKKKTNAAHTYRVNRLTAAKILKDKINHAPYRSSHLGEMPQSAPG